MKLMQLADLHIGKKLNGYSMLDDQVYALGQICDMVQAQGIDAVLVCGDVYDRSTPSVGAVNVLDDFLTRMNSAGVEVFIIGGNHDSIGRLAFMSQIASKEGLHIAKPYSGHVEHIDLAAPDSQGLDKVRIHMLPFVSPSDVRRWHPDAQIESYDDAVRTALGTAEMSENLPNILLSHQLVMGTGELVRSESEQISIGGIDQVSTSAFDGFDYVALGHIHAPQWVVRNKIRYSGTPLKYSFSEVSHTKSATIVEIAGDSGFSFDELPIQPLHEMREVRGTIPELRELATADPSVSNEYVRATLTRPEMNAKAKLTDIFPFLMRTDFDYPAQETGEQSDLQYDNVGRIEEQDPGLVFESLFEQVMGRDMSDEEKSILAEIIVSAGSQTDGSEMDGVER